MSYEKLLSELEDLAKALPSNDGDADDKNIQAAAGEGGEGGEGAAAGAGEGAGAATGGDDDDDDDDKFGKSFSLQLEDGTQIDAVDGTALGKALMTRVGNVEGELAKWLKFGESAMGIIKKQGDLIKSMGEQIKKLGGEGRGRKAVVSVTEKPAPGGAAMAKSEPQGISGHEFMAKAIGAMNEGKLTAGDVALAEGYLNRGLAVPEHIVKSVFA